MNQSVRDGLPPPWWVPDEPTRRALTRELLIEVREGHPVFGLGAEVVHRCGACDEVLIRVSEGDFGMVHLTWSGTPERPPWPHLTHTGGYIATEVVLSEHGLTHDEQVTIRKGSGRYFQSQVWHQASALTA